MKKIYYLHKHLVKIGDVVEYYGIKAIVTEELVSLNPELFRVEDSMQELLDKAKRDYPIGTMFNSKYGVQKVIGDTPIVGIIIPGSVQINTDVFPGGATIYTPEDGWYEILPLKFTTEDGVDIYGDMKTYMVYSNLTMSDKNSNHEGTNSTIKYFYYKENALAYIEKHKEKTLEDYESILFERGNSMTFSSDSIYFNVYGWLKDNEPKLYYTKILQLIADDLNDGWVADFSGFNNPVKYYLISSGWTASFNIDIPGVVYFKSENLAKKAREILGDKVKYLFK